MPYVTVLGLHIMTSDEELEKIESGIKSAVCGIEELGLVGKEDHVRVIMIPGLNYKGRKRQNIRVVTSGLKNLPERTPQVLKRVAALTGMVLDRIFPKAHVASDVAELYDYKTGPFWDND